MDAETEERTLKKFDKRHERIVRDQGYGATVGGLSLTKRCLGPLSEHIRDHYDYASQLHGNDPTRRFIDFLRNGNLDPELVALCTLQNLIHAIALDRGLRDCALVVGRALQGECFAAGLLQHDPKMAAKITKRVKRTHGNIKYRRQAARSLAKRNGFTLKEWPIDSIIRAGLTLIQWATEACSWAFVMSDRNWPAITPEALRVVETAVDHELLRSTVALPLKQPPLPWTGFNTGGYEDRAVAFSRPLVRTRIRESIAAIKGAIADGSMQPTLDALNSIQNVAWTVDERILDVVAWAYDNDVPIKGIPSKADLPKPAALENWDEQDANKRLAWRIRAAQVHTRNRGRIADRVLFAEDIATARLYVGAPFWTPCNLDWRGRVYPLPHFNFQRDDRVRAMFRFASGLPIGERGLYWLKVHVANCGDFGKISKRSIDERVEWVEQNLEWIRDTAVNPFDNAQWRTADKPFLFLAACIELSNALDVGPAFVTHLPVSFDGSCSGLQHLCAMTRAEEGEYVNLTPSDIPQDIYTLVAESVFERIAADADNPLAALWLSYDGDRRKLVKRNTMTYSYSSKTFGMAEQHMKDLMEPLALKVLEGLLLAHPFGEDEGKDASKYLARHVYAAIEEIATKPAEAMGFLQKCARAMAHEGKPLNWTTPAGLPWSNRYHVPLVRKFYLWLSDAEICMNLTVGDQKEIDKDKAANGVAPNFVHALDAAHLMLTVNAAVDEGITDVALVHDSFGCLAPLADRYNAIIREQFVQMYEQHDVLAEVLERAKCDLTIHNTHRLPDPVEPGGLDLKGVLHAAYAFA